LNDVDAMRPITLYLKGSRSFKSSIDVDTIKKPITIGKQ